MFPIEKQLLAQYAAERDADAFRHLFMLHKNMVYATCRRILGNCADAEDVTQACFLKLARDPGQVRSSLAGWLHRAAVGKSVDFIRQDRARRERESQTAPRAEDLEASSRNTLFELIDTAVEELPETLRIPLIRYYLEEHTQEEISSELNISQSTVARRLQRGVHALRAKLRKAGWAGSVALLASLLATSTLEAAPASLTAALGKMAMAGVGGSATGAVGGGAAASTTAAAGTAAGTTTAAATATTTIGGIGIMKLSLIGITTAAAITVGVIAQQSAKSDPGTPPAARKIEAAMVSAADSQPTKQSLQENLPATYGPMSCSGTVLDAQGKPIEGAEVVVCLPRPYSTFHGMDVRNRLFRNAIITKADGRFTFDLHGAHGNIYIGARKEGLAVDYGFHRFALGELRDTLCLRSPTVLAGAVVDEKGKPVANAVVEAFLSQFSGPSGWLTTTTGANGAFSFNNIPQQAKAGFRVTAPGRAPVLSYTASGDQWENRFRAGEKDIRLVLPAVAKIAGRVLDKASGRPIPGLAFRVMKSGKPFVCFTVVSDADGKFEFEGVEAGEYWLYQLPPEEKTRPKIVKTIKFLAKASETTRLELKAVTGGIVRVLVRDAKTKRPIPGALASMDALKSSQEKYATAEYCDANGVALLCAPAGEYGVQPPNAKRFGYPFHPRFVVDQPISRQGRITRVVSGQTVQVVMDMISTSRFTGVVRDPEGRTVAGAEIEIGPFSGDIYRGIFRTNDKGRYDLQWIPFDRERPFVFARVPERNLVAVAAINESTIEKDLVLKPGLFATGRIVNETGAPIPVASVSLHVRENKNRVLCIGAHTDSDGKFSIPALLAPSTGLRYLLTVEAVGYAGIPLRDHNSRLAALEAGASDISGKTLHFWDIVLSPDDFSQSVAGIVVDQQGRPAAGVRVFAGGPTGGERTTTDANGEFVITGLGKGQMRVQASTSRTEDLGYVTANGGDQNVRIVLGKREP